MKFRRKLLRILSLGDPEKMAWEGIEITQKDGTKRLVTAVNIPLFDQNMMISTVQDTTKKAQAEQNLKRSEERFRSVTENTPLGTIICTLSADGAVVIHETNSSASEILGINIREKIGQTIEDAFPGIGSTEYPDIFRKIARDGIQWQFEDVYYLKDNFELYYEVYAFQIVQDSLAIIFSDVTERNKSREQLNEQAHLLEIISDAVISGNMEFEIKTWNHAAEEIYGWKEEEVIGKKFHKVVQPDYINNDRDEIIKIFRSEGYWEGEVLHLTKSGDQKFIHTSVTMMSDLDGNVSGQVSVQRDITEKKLFELEQAKSTERLRILHLIDTAILEKVSPEEIAATAAENLLEHLDCLKVGILTLDQAGENLLTLATTSSPNQPQKIPLSAVSMDNKLFVPQQQMNKVVYLDSLEMEDKNSELFVHGENERVIFVPMLSKDTLIGSIFLTFSKEKELTENDQVISSTIANQLAIAIEQAHLRNQIENNWIRMQKLAQKVITVQEDERRLISRELHDEAGQSLTALKIDLELLKLDIPEEQEELYDRLESTIALADDILENLRRLAQGLRPPSIDTIGLLPTMESMCAEHKQRTGMQVVFESPDEFNTPEELQIVLYRFQQEALTNITKHSKATRVDISIQQLKDHIRLSIQDNGVGFLENDAQKSSGLGIVSMKERLEIIGGHLEIKSQPGQGTHLIGIIPITTI